MEISVWVALSATKGSESKAEGRQADTMWERMWPESRDPRRGWSRQATRKDTCSGGERGPVRNSLYFKLPERRLTKRWLQVSEGWAEKGCSPMPQDGTLLLKFPSRQPPSRDVVWLLRSPGALFLPRVGRPPPCLPSLSLCSSVEWSRIACYYINTQKSACKLCVKSF